VRVMDEDRIGNRNSFKIEQFEGPLDLLLFLIQKNEVNIYDIPISEITEQYLEFLQLSTAIDLDNLTEFYAMAATLLYIKSRMLLPVEVEFDEEFEDPRQELVTRLLEYQKYKKYAALIADRSTEVDYLFTRRQVQKPLPFDDTDLWNEIDSWDLLKTFSSILAKISPERVFDMYEEVTVNEKLTLMHELFERSPVISFQDLVVRHHSPLDIICSFLALLEAVKIRMIRIFQNVIFGDIRIEKRTDVTELFVDENPTS